MILDPVAADHEQALALLEDRFAQAAVAVPGGATVAVRSAGTAGRGPAIVLLHGIGSGAASWLHVALALSPRAHIVAWDAPGYGGSTPLAPRMPSAADYAGRLHALMAAMGIGSCVLVGHSLGALTAAAFAAGPGRRVVQRLVLISPARGYGGAGREAERQRVLDTRLAALQSGGVAGIAAQAATRMLSAAASPSARAWVQWNAARLDPAGYTQAVHMLCGDDIHRYARVTMPVEVHCGDADTLTTPGACRDVALRFSAPFALIPRAGHASPVEQALAVARLVARAAQLSPGDEQP